MVSINSVALWVASALFVLAFIAVPEPSSAATPAKRVLLLRVTDSTGRASAKQIRRNLERAISGTSKLTLLRLRRWRKAARNQRIPKRKWLSRSALRKIGSSLKLDSVAVARLIRRHRGRRLQYRLVLTALDIKDGLKRSRRLVDLTHPKLSLADARHAVSTLSWGRPRSSGTPPKPSLSKTRRPEKKITTETERTEPEDTLERPENDSLAQSATEENSEWSAAGSGWESADSATVQAKPVTTSTDDGSQAFAVNLSGRVSAEHFAYFKDLGEDKVAGRNSVDFALQAEARAKHVAVLGRFLVRHDFSNRRRDRITAEEAYVETSAGSLTLRAGRVIANWGTANLISPVNILNSIDMRDPIDPEQWGTWMIRIAWLIGRFSLEGYYLPVPQANNLPFPDRLSTSGQPIGRSRWLIPGQAITAPLGSPPLRFSINPVSPPRSSIENTQLGARLVASFPLVDFALSYLWRFDPLPGIRTTQTPDDPDNPQNIDILISPEFERVHMITFEAESTAGKFRLATEALLELTENLDNKDQGTIDPYVSAVAGVDYRTGAFFVDHHLHLFLDLWFARVLTGTLGDQLTDRLRIPFSQAALSRLRYEVGESLRIDINLFSSLERYDMLVNSNIEWIAHDRITLQLGATVLLGSRTEGFFGPFRDNTRVEASAEVAF